MRRSELKSWPAGPAVRKILIAEVAFYLASAIVYAWLALPADVTVHWHEVVFFTYAVAFPVAMNVLHGDWFKDSGIRLDNFGRSAREAALATAILAAGLAALGLALGSFHWVSWPRMLGLAGGYVTWGVAQQYLLQSFSLRRLMQAGLSGWTAAIAAALGFAALHSPNWPLVAATAVAGIVWCRLFLRNPNIFTLGLAHGILAVLLFHALPVSWLHNLRIGPDYLRPLSGH